MTIPPANYPRADWVPPDPPQTWVARLLAVLKRWWR